MQGGVCAKVLELVLALNRLMSWMNHDQEGKGV